MRQGSGPTFVFHQNSNIPLITLDTASSTIFSSVLDTSPYRPHKFADVDIIKPFTLVALLNRKLKTNKPRAQSRVEKMNQVTRCINLFNSFT